MIEVDTSQFPLITQHWHSEPSLSELKDYTVRADAIADRAIASNCYYVVVVSGSLSANGRKYLSEWIKSVPKARRERMIASYVVVSNAAIRGMLTALRWITDDLDDVHAVASKREGLRLAQARLAQRALAPPLGAMAASQ